MDKAHLTNNHWKHAACDVLAKVEVKIENLQVALTKKKYDRDLTEETRNERFTILRKELEGLWSANLAKRSCRVCWMV